MGPTWKKEKRKTTHHLDRRNSNYTEEKGNQRISLVEERWCVNTVQPDIIITEIKCNLRDWFGSLYKLDNNNQLKSGMSLETLGWKHLSVPGIESVSDFMFDLWAPPFWGELQCTEQNTVQYIPLWTVITTGQQCNRGGVLLSALSS